MKFWKKKDKSKLTSNNPFEQDYTSNNSNDTYSQNVTAVDNSSYHGRYGNTTNSIKTRDPNQDRQNLFAGYTESKVAHDTNGQADRYQKNQFAEDDEDEEVVQIKQQIRNVKQDSLASTRNALQRINEAEATAANTLNMLGTQSSQIANVERHLDLSKAYSDRASAQAGELKQLNRSIFIPVVKNPFNKESRHRKAMDKINKEHAEHMAERENIRQFEYDSSARIEDAQRMVARERAREGHYQGRSQADRNKYQFEADEEDDAIEDEIDHNLDLLGDATARLKAMAVTMNDELSSQNKQLDKINRKVDPINSKLISTTYTLNSTR
ncbi:uncharacterized protein BX663DRAFT_547834 [Cokeromyces recurvatus]|uniref:uncharacterized protein n=1 Tax=Cokeromyces recurvatus TaxID=90255 RepID=UPI0022210E16|nr:uncharacterized protein BX663DRAFT_547834 [Cokeromyces recurvatus]KAI7908220.1 hypothetical protein BX663DRAFT_547834 [Cokeromyces recurvatus]